MASRRRISSVSPLAGQQDAQVAVDGFGGMQKQSRRTGRTERCGNLLGNDAALAHAGDHDAAPLVAAAEDQLNGASKRLGHRAFKARRQRFERRRLGAD